MKTYIVEYTENGVNQMILVSADDKTKAYINAYFRLSSAAIIIELYEVR